MMALKSSQIFISVMVFLCLFNDGEFTPIPGLRVTPLRFGRQITYPDLNLDDWQINRNLRKAFEAVLEMLRRNQYFKRNLSNVRMF